jgi:hypothetical protein
VFNAIGVGATVDIIPGSLPDSQPQIAPVPKAQHVNTPIVGQPEPQTVAVAASAPR